MLGALIIKIKAGQGFEYLSNRDISSFLSGWSDDAIFIFPGNVSASGEYRGIDNIKEWWERFFEQFPEVKFTCKNVFIKNCLALGGTNEITLHWENELINKNQIKINNSGVSVVKVKGGKIVYLKDYFFSTESMAEAWSEN